MIGLPNGDMEWRKRSSAPPRNRWPAKRVGILTISYGCTHRLQIYSILFPFYFVFGSAILALFYMHVHLQEKVLKLHGPIFFILKVEFHGRC